MTMTEAEKKWIDDASYSDLLKRWRFAPAGDLIFQGQSGQYYAEVMKTRRSEAGEEEHTRVSKKVGWRKD